MTPHTAAQRVSASRTLFFLKCFFLKKEEQHRQDIAASPPVHTLDDCATGCRCSHSHAHMHRRTSCVHLRTLHGSSKEGRRRRRSYRLLSSAPTIRQSNTFGITNNTHENTHENSATRIAAATCAAGRYSSCPRVKAEHPDGQCEAEPPGK